MFVFHSLEDLELILIIYCFKKETLIFFLKNEKLQKPFYL